MVAWRWPDDAAAVLAVSCGKARENKPARLPKTLLILELY